MSLLTELAPFLKLKAQSNDEMIVLKIYIEPTAPCDEQERILLDFLEMRHRPKFVCLVR